MSWCAYFRVCSLLIEKEKKRKKKKEFVLKKVYQNCFKKYKQGRKFVLKCSYIIITSSIIKKFSNKWEEIVAAPLPVNKQNQISNKPWLQLIVCRPVMRPVMARGSLLLPQTLIAFTLRL